MNEAEAKKFAKGYLKMFPLLASDAAKEGRISSKTLAEMRFSVAAIRKRARGLKRAEKEAKASNEKFVNTLDPVSQKAFTELSAEIQAKRKAEGKNKTENCARGRRGPRGTASDGTGHAGHRERIG